ncbi:MAG: TonB-dependent receptor [Acidobacteriota bacterium]
MKKNFIVVFALALLAMPVAADGPETGVIAGQVTDAQGGPLPGVTVTATGDRGTKTAITDTQGAYRFALLIPGDYKVRAELDGFTAAEAAASVSAGQKADVNLTLSMGVSDTITVTSEAPMVDKFNVTAGSTVTSEVGQEVAGSTRTYYGVINTLPGVTSDSQNQDIQQTRPSVNGASWADNNVFIDGVDTSFARFGGSRVFLPTTAVTEVTMESGGSSAEYGRSAGSTTNVVVKSGTNTFHGDFLVQRQEVEWGSDFDSHVELTQREDFPRPANFFERSSFEEENTSTGFEASLGGPLARDKAWFFLGWSDFDTNDLDKALNADPVDVSLKNEAYIGKFNFQPSQSHSIAASYIDTPAFRNYFNPESNDYWTPTPHIIDGTLATLSWNYSISSNFFLETKVATQESTENKFLACGSQIIDDCLTLKQQDRGPDGEGPLRFPANEAAGPHWPGNNYRVYIDVNNDSAWNNGWILDNGFGINEFPRDQANFSLTQFAGANHEFKYGVDWQEVAWESDVGRPGLYSGFDFDPLNPFGFANAGTGALESCGLLRATNADIAAAFGAGNTCLFRDYNAPFLQAQRGSGDSLNEDLGIYLRDRFTVGDHWTFNLGLRVDDSSGENDIGRTVFDATNVSPRIAITYDISGDGKTLLSLNTGRYYAQLNQQWTNEHLQDQWGGYAEYDDFLFCDAIDVAFGACSEVGYNFFFRRIQPGRMWDLVDEGVWDSDIDPYYKDEVILGFERQLSSNWAVDVKGIYWELGDMIGATIQVSPDGDQFRMTANYKDYVPILRAMDDVRVSRGEESLFQDGQLENFREGSKEYTALQVQLNRRFANGWALYNNVTWSELETTGAGAWWNNTNDSYGENLHQVLTQDNLDLCNANQFDRTIPVDCNVLQPFVGTSVSTINRLGSDGLIDRPIIFNSFGFKTWTFGRQNLTAGGHFTFQSGTAWGRSEGVGTVSIDGNTAQSASVNLQLEPLGERRLDDTFNVNLNLAWGFPIFGQTTGQFRVEVLNATNQQEQTFVTGRGEARAVRRDFQRPRQARVNFAIRF